MKKIYCAVHEIMVENLSLNKITEIVLVYKSVSEMKLQCKYEEYQLVHEIMVKNFSANEIAAPCANAAPMCWYVNHF